MHGKIHKIMALQIIKDFPYQEMALWLYYHTDSNKDKMTHLMDVYDDQFHHSKSINEHSCKHEMTATGWVVHKPHAYDSDVVTIAGRDTKDIMDFIVEGMHKMAVYELLRTIHFIVDISSPPHVCWGFDSQVHCDYEHYADVHWQEYYKKAVPVAIKQESIALWGLELIKGNYDRNMRLLDSAIKNKEYIVEPAIKDITQNLNDYLFYLYLYLKRKGVFEW